MELFGRRLSFGKICVSSQEDPAVQIAVRNLASDIKAVCGVLPEITDELTPEVRILVGTYGVSGYLPQIPPVRLLDELVNPRWEGF